MVLDVVMVDETYDKNKEWPELTKERLKNVLKLIFILYLYLNLKKKKKKKKSNFLFKLN